MSSSNGKGDLIPKAAPRRKHLKKLANQNDNNEDASNSDLQPLTLKPLSKKLSIKKPNTPPPAVPSKPCDRTIIPQHVDSSAIPNDQRQSNIDYGPRNTSTITSTATIIAVKPASSIRASSTAQPPIPALPVKPKPQLRPEPAKRKSSRFSERQSTTTATTVEGGHDPTVETDNRTSMASNGPDEASGGNNDESTASVSSNQKLVDARRTLAGVLAKQVLSARINKDADSAPPAGGSSSENNRNTASTTYEQNEECVIPIEQRSSVIINSGTEVKSVSTNQVTTNPRETHENGIPPSRSSPPINATSPLRSSPPVPTTPCSPGPPPPMPRRPPAPSPRPAMATSRAATLTPSRPAPQPSRTTWYMQYDHRHLRYVDQSSMSSSHTSTATEEIVPARKAVKYPSVYGDSAGGGGGLLGTRSNSIVKGVDDTASGEVRGSTNASGQAVSVASTATVKTAGSTVKPKLATKPTSRRKSSKQKKPSSIFYTDDIGEQPSSNLYKRALSHEKSHTETPALSHGDHCVTGVHTISSLNQPAVELPSPNCVSTPVIPTSPPISHVTSPDKSHQTCHATVTPVTHHSANDHCTEDSQSMVADENIHSQSNNINRSIPINEPHCIALVDYAAQTYSELSFTRGECIRLLYMDWDNKAVASVDSRTGSLDLAMVDVVCPLPKDNVVNTANPPCLETTVDTSLLPPGVCATTSDAGITSSSCPVAQTVNHTSTKDAPAAKIVAGVDTPSLHSASIASVDHVTMDSSGDEYVLPSEILVPENRKRSDHETPPDTASATSTIMPPSPEHPSQLQPSAPPLQQQQQARMVETPHHHEQLPAHSRNLEPQREHSAEQQRLTTQPNDPEQQSELNLPLPLPPQAQPTLPPPSSGFPNPTTELAYPEPDSFTPVCELIPTCELSPEITPAMPEIGRPISDIAPPISDIAPPTSDIAPPTSDIAPPTSDITPPTSDITPPTSDITPPISDIAPPTSDIAPPTSDIAPPTSDIAPPTSDITPPISDITPPISDSVPPISDSAPPISDIAPSPTEITPPTSDIAPPTSDIAPPISDIAPPTSDINPPTSDIAPPTSDIAPPTSDIAPPPSDIAPPISDIAPPTSQIIPTILDNSADINANTKKPLTAIALYEFTPDNTSELRLTPGDLVFDLYTVDNDWLKGCIQGDLLSSGIFPRSFVKIDGNEDDIRPLQLEATVIYEFAGVHEDELSLKVGDLVTSIVEVSSDWLHGRRRVDGVAGIFPLSFVRIVNN